MVNRWLWWAPLGLVTLGCAIFGLRMGWIAATISETDVITHFAAKYVNDHGGDARVTDCVAYPTDSIPGIWILVRCAPMGALENYDYYVNRFGGLEHGDWPAELKITPQEPQT